MEKNKTKGAIDPMGMNVLNPKRFSSFRPQEFIRSVIYKFFARRALMSEIL